jgi:heme A synthase
MEYVHRLIALGVTVFLVLMAYQSYHHKDEIRQEDPVGMRRFLLTLLITALLFFQITLGGLTIITFLDEFVVTTHLAVATLIFGLTIIHHNWVSHSYIPNGKFKE